MAKRGRPKKIKETSPEIKDYTATIKVLGKMYHALGNSLLEAISALKPGIARGVSILTITHGDKTIEKILVDRQTRGLFHPSPTVHSIHLKNVSQYFNL